MIAALHGTVEDISSGTVVLNVAGVGYEVRCSQGCVDRLAVGQIAHIVIHTAVREDAINLYGFADRLEKEVFGLLMSVKGVGAKSAAAIISRIDKIDLLRAIGSGDITHLQSVRGIGKKTAERMVVELRDKVAELTLIDRAQDVTGVRAASRPVEDAIQALQALGFARKDAERAVAAVQEDDSDSVADAGEIVKAALRFV